MNIIDARGDVHWCSYLTDRLGSILRMTGIHQPMLALAQRCRTFCTDTTITSELVDSFTFQKPYLVIFEQ